MLSVVALLPWRRGHGELNDGLVWSAEFAALLGRPLRGRCACLPLDDVIPREPPHDNLVDVEYSSGLRHRVQSQQRDAGFSVDCRTLEALRLLRRNRVRLALRADKDDKVFQRHRSRIEHLVQSVDWFDPGVTCFIVECFLAYMKFGLSL